MQPLTMPLVHLIINELLTLHLSFVEYIEEVDGPWSVRSACDRGS
jgi:hypothetical protein